MPTWTYNFNPGSSPLMLTRFLCGDTDESDPLLMDGELGYLLGLTGNTPLLAAERACEAIIAKLSRAANESVGAVRIEYAERVKGYRETKTLLTGRIAIEMAVPYAGGISLSDKSIAESDTDRTAPMYTVHSGNTPGLRAGDASVDPGEVVATDATGGAG